MEELIDSIYEKLHCSSRAANLQKLNYIREMLARFQLQEIFLQVFGPHNFIEDFGDDGYAARFQECKKSNSDILHGKFDAVEEEEEFDIEENLDEFEPEEDNCTTESSEYESQPQDNWMGYFKGYSILGDFGDSVTLANKKCIQLSLDECNDAAFSYLRSGIRCFAIDLFVGTDIENQGLIVNLCEKELSYSKVLGFPISTTLIARISPRLQYTGDLDENESDVTLMKGDEIILTTDRNWSRRSTKHRVYVNANFLLVDIKEFDYILLGCDIQLWVKKKEESHLLCAVDLGGLLKSRMPVLFPGRCHKFHISHEELEDITFCKEVGINIIVTYIAGSKEYLDNLKEVLRLLQCDKMRIFARIVLNEIKGCDNDMDWAAESYCGFIVELNDSKAHLCGSLLHLCPTAISFLERAHYLKKPIILDPSPVASKRLLVDSEYQKYIFFYPDKYLSRCSVKNDFYFYMLHEAIAPPLVECDLSQQPYCDESLAGSDSLARACVSASHEMNASVIFVCGLTGRSAQKIAYFRPKAHIIFITRQWSAAKFVSAYYNVTMLYYCGKFKETHQNSIYKHLLYGMLYAKAQYLLKHNDNVIFVYNEEPGIKYLDKYVVYKYHENHFAKHLEKFLITHKAKQCKEDSTV